MRIWKQISAELKNFRSAIFFPKRKFVILTLTDLPPPMFPACIANIYDCACKIMQNCCFGWNPMPINRCLSSSHCRRLLLQIVTCIKKWIRICPQRPLTWLGNEASKVLFLNVLMSPPPITKKTHLKCLERPVLSSHWLGNEAAKAGHTWNRLPWYSALSKTSYPILSYTTGTPQWVRHCWNSCLALILKNRTWQQQQ